MNEKPILFNAEMVQAILSGRKTQTRRIIKLDHERGMVNPVVRGRNGEISSITCRLVPMLCPLGQPGDQLWVREAFAAGLCTESTLAYRATHKTEDLEEGWGETIKWTPSIHMPRWASRIDLLITGVRVERLQSITIGDICKEVGCGLYDFFPATDGFRVWTELWDSIYGQKEGENWQANPWVWVINFERMEAK
ncbi:hypothetical protein RSF04_000049 [Yersinia enterocolitica]|nr:hypothetical protein [Yersinia enterocolitica]